MNYIRITFVGLFCNNAHFLCIHFQFYILITPCFPLQGRTASWVFPRRENNRIWKPYDDFMRNITFAIKRPNKNDCDSLITHRRSAVSASYFSKKHDTLLWKVACLHLLHHIPSNRDNRNIRKAPITWHRHKWQLDCPKYGTKCKILTCGGQRLHACSAHAKK